MPRPLRNPLPHTLLALLVLLLPGCTNYDYRIDAPPPFAGPVPEGQFRTLDRPPLSYAVQDVEGKLLVHIRNDAESQIALLGKRSSVVGPDGQAHGLQTRPIPPGAFVKLIIPPNRPDAGYYGPRSTFGIGFGTRIGSAGAGSVGGVGGVGDVHEPGLFDVAQYDDQPRTFDDYWRFDGPGTMRLILTYRLDDDVLQQTFTVTRFKRE